VTLSSEDEEEFDDILEEESNVQHGRSIGSLTITEDGVKMDSISTEFNKNQNVELKLLDDGVLEFTVLQEHSTPGVRVSQILDMPIGVYEMTVVGNTLATGTFFPWARETGTGMRITETTHIDHYSGSVSIPLVINHRMSIEIGVLSHNARIGDKCRIESIEISKRKEREISSAGKFISICREDLVAHGSTNLSETLNGVLVTSEPVSTPGAYSLVDVSGGETLTIKAKIAVDSSSVAFLYVADAGSGKELINRNIVFRTAYPNGLEEPQTANTFVRVPEGIQAIRVGILFSSASKSTTYKMMIHQIEVAPFISLMDVVSQIKVLNLSGEEEKFKFCEWQAWRFGLDISRFEAVNGNLPDIKKDWSKYMEKPFSDYDKKLNRKAIEKPGAWGYLLSMKQVFQDALDQDLESVAVFDDDFVLSNNFEHEFSRLMHSIGDDWDVIYLGASQWSWDGVVLDNQSYYVPDANTNGTFAVLYRRSVFQEILDGIELMDAPFDSGPLRNVVMTFSKGRSFVAQPNIVIANIEKPGIRDSRNQIEYSRRFRWNLDDFPSWFTDWNPTPKLVLDSGTEHMDHEETIHSDHLVTAVTTFNRLHFLKQFIETWIATREMKYEHTLIITDDGSTDGTIEWVCNDLEIENVRVILIRNDGRGIARQSNSIFDIIENLKLPPSLAFICNDDINFKRKGWQSKYLEAVNNSGFDHLVYFNPNWKEGSMNSMSTYESSTLVARCTPREAMGCFYTVTPRLLSKIGYFDEESFPVRGHSHIDFTMRACRVGANEFDGLNDVEGSGEFIDMIMRDDYVGTPRILTLKENDLIRSDESLHRRENTLLDETRTRIEKAW